ncbi:hypothetical protein [Williamsia sp. CHRR-6]|uniref:hypothetical protein n=1 Tax=Williamsia sp. CHRR-6 TaxID=2835871 RepID=UPI001BDAA0AB|nr:hypothetical protein [Williamsia sp. CHRR-6]MBT0567800.1 hypothetical protein [Williamsia sp. CHRR-6]
MKLFNKSRRLYGFACAVAVLGGLVASAPTAVAQPAAAAPNHAAAPLGVLPQEGGFNSSAPIYAGDRIRNITQSTNGNVDCTVGAVLLPGPWEILRNILTVGFANTRWLVTAGHCGNVGDSFSAVTSGEVMGYIDKKLDNADVAFIKVEPGRKGSKNFYCAPGSSSIGCTGVGPTSYFPRASGRVTCSQFGRDARTVHPVKGYATDLQGDYRYCGSFSPGEQVVIPRIEGRGIPNAFFSQVRYSLPGDSGCPIFRLGADGAYLAGITSTRQQALDPNNPHFGVTATNLMFAVDQTYHILEKE